MKRKDKILFFFLVTIILIISEMYVLFNDSNIYKYKEYSFNQNSRMTDYHLGNESLFDENDIELITHAEKYSSASTYDLTNIANTGCVFYYQYLITGDIKFAQLTLYYANFLLSEGNFYDFGDYILFPNHLGYTYLEYRTIRKEYEDAMGASFAAILFINTDELLIQYNISNQYYIDNAKKVVQGILLSYKENGGKIILSDNENWFIHHYEQNRVLNGHMFTLANLFRYMNYTSDFSIKDEITKGINSLKNQLHLYIKKNKQMYDLKKFVEDMGYAPYFSPYYRAHPLLLYYLYKNTGDRELLEYYFIFLESSLFECQYFLDANPFLNDDKLYLQLSMISNEENLFSRSNSSLYRIPLTKDFYFRGPIVNLNLLNSLNLTYFIRIPELNFYLTENVRTNFTSDIFVNIYKIEFMTIEIKILTNCYKLELNCNIKNSQINIKDKKLTILDLSDKIQEKNDNHILIMYFIVIIIIICFIIIINKKIKQREII
ncbi:MAG: hypothetical protein GF308_03885 [Candidatus Heimdallarchaeota archaeon]|nr:hypothetical protein [Candidatus Heimdallarchaeota archaeon]